MWYTFFKLVFVRPFTKLFLRTRLLGADNIPAKGPAVLAANHLDAGDTFTLPCLMRRRLTFPAKKELFEGKGLKGRTVAIFLTAVGQVPLDRSGGRAAAGTMGPIEKILSEGGLVGIFPEGSRSPDDRLYKGHTGVARLALTHGVPVIPIGMINTRIKKGLLGLPTMHDGCIVIGEPLDFSPWQGQQDNLPTLRWVTNEVMRAIQTITGQTYVDVYATRVKYGNLKGKDVTAFIKSRPNDGVGVPLSNRELEANRPDDPEAQ